MRWLIVDCCTYLEDEVLVGQYSYVLIHGPREQPQPPLDVLLALGAQRPLSLGGHDVEGVGGRVGRIRFVAVRG